MKRHSWYVYYINSNWKIVWTVFEIVTVYPMLFLQIKFIGTHLLVYIWSAALAIAEFSSVTETIRLVKPKIFTIHRKWLQVTDPEGKKG